jgi:hypothetical protein
MEHNIHYFASYIKKIHRHLVDIVGHAGHIHLLRHNQGRTILPRNRSRQLQYPHYVRTGIAFCFAYHPFCCHPHVGKKIQIGLREDGVYYTIDVYLHVDGECRKTIHDNKRRNGATGYARHCYHSLVNIFLKSST